MNIYDYVVTDNAGNSISLADYRDKVLLIVNTATGCGFTPQYEGLQALYEKYQSQGFEILDFPCNQFGNQAPGTSEEISGFCSLKYGTTFKQFAKIDVNGKAEEPFYTYLKSQKGGALGNNVKSNITKFLVDHKDNVIERFAPTTTPQKMDEAIRGLLEQK